MKTKVPLKQQIQAVQSQADICTYSYMHRIGKYKGRIPPGDDLDNVNALKAAVKTLRTIER